VRSGYVTVVDTTALLCRACAWFGVYRSDVTQRIGGCPVCGSALLSARDIDDDDWHDLGRQLLADAESVKPAREDLHL
jgi:hypothetical protein